MDYVKLRRNSEMLTATRILLVAVFALLAGAAHAEGLTGDNMKSLDGQVQEIKSDVLDIASELQNLEERLLYPSGTQLSIFVAVEEDRAFRLDAVKIEINVTTGNHELLVTVIGKTDGGKDFTRSGTFAFAKGVKPKTLGITLAEPGLGNDGIQVGDW